MDQKVERLKRKVERLKRSQQEAEKLLEEKSHELYLLNQSLEREVNERTKELKAAMEEAVQATKGKDRFLARMSHEIRTPLNGILGILDLLEKTSLDEEQKEYVKISSESGEILLSIINDILEYSKITAGKSQIEVSEFDLQKSMESVANILYYKAQEKGLNLLVDIRENCPRIFSSDERKIRQILINLIGNSIKFTPSGEICVRLEPHRNGVQITVSDSGIGIPKEKIESIFDSFTQADARDTRKYGGSGLGLSICKNFVQLLGGKIRVESEEGVGTKFIFSLLNYSKNQPNETPNFPNKSFLVCVSNKTQETVILNRLTDWCVPAKTIYSLYDIKELGVSSFSHLLLDYSMLLDDWQPPPGLNIFVLAKSNEGKQAKDKYPGINIINPPLYRSKLLSIFEKLDVHEDLPQSTEILGSQGELPILLVEDNLINQKVAQHIFKLAGFDCDIANNGAEAVEMVKKNFYQIIFMDYNMPIMGGVEATKKIRSYQEGQDKLSVIIAMTASALKETREKCVEAGMDGFITKPIKPDDIIDKIKRLLAKTKKTA